MDRKSGKKYNGIIRNIVGDAYILTFDKIEYLLNAVKNIDNYWSKVYYKYNFLRLRLGIHKGRMLQYRSFFGGDSFNLAAALESSGKLTDAYRNNKNIVVTHASDIIKREAIKYNERNKNMFIEVKDEEIKNIKSIKQREILFKTTYIYYPNS